MEDKRFAHITKDPKFRRVPKTQSKVKIDQRFQSMFTAKQFEVKYTSDKRGRPVEFHSKNDLRRYYEVSSEEEEEESDQEGPPGSQYVKAPPLSQSEDESDGNSVLELDSKEKSDKSVTVEAKDKLKNLSIDYARGERNLFSESSSDDEETDEEVSESEEIDHKWGELDADAGQTEEPTYRLAACNLDWDRIRAVDLMVLLSSFLPPRGVIKSVVIYPSEFGKKRLKEEELKGPIELVEAAEKDVQIDDADGETEEGSKYHMERLRQYQLNRLKYYYAVVTFDSANSANKVYTECDGMEYESSATKMDLRFIPDDMTFEDDPKESCKQLPEKYEPRFFTTTALQQAKVELTWDETDPGRLELNEKLNSGKIDDISANELQNLLAGSSEEEESGNSDEELDSENSQSGNTIDKYKALLQDIQEKETEKNNEDIGLEISWGIDLKEKTDKLMKEKMKGTDEKTPFQKYLDKKKEKRKERKELKKTKAIDQQDSDVPSDIDMNDPYFAEEFNNPEFKKTTVKKNKKKREDLNEDTLEGKQKEAELDLLLMNEEEENGKKHFSFKKIQEKDCKKAGKKKKGKNRKTVEGETDVAGDDDFKINVEDERFSAIFKSHHYNIDPTDPRFKKTKGMETLIQEKVKRRLDDAPENPEKKGKLEPTSNQKKSAELRLLVKNVKRKTQEFKQRK